MATLLSGTSQNVPSILGIEMIFREDYKSRDEVGKIFHANKLQNGLAILSLQTCMLTALTAHWLFIARTVQWIRVALRRTVQWIRIVLRAT